MKTVYIDLETGGLDIQRSPIIQIAAIATTEGQIVEEFERKVLFDFEKADPEALKLNSYDATLWDAAGISEAGAITALSEFLKRHSTLEMTSQRTGRPYMVAQLAGHNAASFDGPMLRSAYVRNSAFFPASFLVLDTLQLAMWFCRIRGQKPANMKLSTLAKHFGFDCGEAHDALADAKMAFCVANHIHEQLRIAA